jgi:hypothetical protein
MESRISGTVKAMLAGKLGMAMEVGTGRVLSAAERRRRMLKRQPELKKLCKLKGTK